jgi:hypothetical protein
MMLLLAGKYKFDNVQDIDKTRNTLILLQSAHAATPGQALASVMSL